jgi:hypothetical protein
MIRRDHGWSPRRLIDSPVDERGAPRPRHAALGQHTPAGVKRETTQRHEHPDMGQRGKFREKVFVTVCDFLR